MTIQEEILRCMNKAIQEELDKIVQEELYIANLNYLPLEITF